MAGRAERWPYSGPFVGRELRVVNPLELLGGIVQELTAAGYSLLLSARHGSISAAGQSAEGVILLGQGAHREAVGEIDRWNLALVVWGARSGDGNQVVVGSDNRSGGLRLPSTLSRWAGNARASWAIPIMPRTPSAWPALQTR